MSHCLSESYLSDKIHDILIDSCKSQDSKLDFRLTQGFVVAPRMYCMHTNPLGEIIKGRGFKYRSYAHEIPVQLT